jgi:hypothetical protein
MNKGVLSKEGDAIVRVILCMTSLILGILYQGIFIFNVIFFFIGICLLIENWNKWKIGINGLDLNGKND